ncbi:esterase EstA [Stutzerimonas stutzeri TS44]|nr:esterase EstA [Stutzerimonas stutzeri TS44]
MHPTTRPLAALLLAILAGSAAAADGPFSQFINFGDSLSDAGNFPDLGSPLLSGYPTGGLRFTNRTGPSYGDGNVEYAGQVTTQLLAERLGLTSLPSTPLLPQLLTGNPDGTNYAVGGYRTDQILDSISGTSTVTAGSLSRSRDGYLVEHPQADPNALYYLNGGANDIFQLGSRPTTMAAAAGNLVAGVSALAEAGARYIIVSDLPDVGSTPLGTLTGNSAQLNALSDQYNAELEAQLRGSGANYVLLNSRGLLDEVRANLAQFGFAADINQNAVCFSGDSCLADPTYGRSGSNPDPDRLLFNDAVHPTTALHRISADYLYSIVAAPWEISRLPEMGQAALRAQLQQLDQELMAQRGRWQPVGEWRIQAGGGYRSPDFDDYGSGDGDSQSLSLNLSHRLSEQWLAGLSLAVGENGINLGAGESDYDMHSYLATAFARYEQDRLFADFTLSGGHLDYHDLQRRFALGSSERVEQGSTDGQLWALGTKLGFNLMQAQDAMQFGPFIGASYQRVEVDGYSEHGERSTAMTFADQERDSLRLSLGLFGDLALSERTRLYGEVAREVEREDEDPEDLRMSLNSLPGNSFELPGAVPSGDQTRFSVGLTHQLATDLALRANYHYRGNDNRDHGLNLSLSWDL